jgi:hypothetical protein
MNDPMTTNKVAPAIVAPVKKIVPTIPMSAVAAFVAATPGARYFAPLRMVIGPPTSGCSISSTLAYVGPVKPYIAPVVTNPFTEPSLTADVSEVQQELIAFLAGGTIAGEPSDKSEAPLHAAARAAMNEKLRQWLEATA